MAAQPDLFAAAAPGDNRLREPLGACFDRVPAGWHPVTEAFRRSPTGQALIEFVDSRVRGGATVYPAEVFKALMLTPLSWDHSCSALNHASL